VPYKAMLNQAGPLVVAVEAAAGRAAGTGWEGPMAVDWNAGNLVSIGTLITIFAYGFRHSRLNGGSAGS
jgi:hypothetical protein